MTRYGGTNWDSMRTSDADRERAADVLKAGLAEGRLDWAEHQRRLDQVMEAQTYGQLQRLTADLPHGALPGPPVAPQYPAVRPGWGRPVLPQKEPLASTSMALGIASPFACGLTSIPAVVTGHVALSRIKRTGAEGHSQAVAGLTMGYLFSIFGFLWLLLFILGIAF